MVIIMSERTRGFPEKSLQNSEAAEEREAAAHTLRAR
jgi:hypothetical protein